MLKIKDIFGITIEGEGLFTGTKAIFIRLSGCNIWNGDPETKAKSACPYCDTDFNGGDDLSTDNILEKIFEIDSHKTVGLINITGGEPLLQDLDDLCAHLIGCGYEVNIETNGTKDLSDRLKSFFNKGLSVTCSPKVPKKAVKLDDDFISCLKILYPHPRTNIVPEDYLHLKCSKYIQPIEENGAMNYKNCLRKLYCLPSDWKLSVQLHKIIGVE